MADILALHSNIEHHTLEMIAWQFDGTNEGAMKGTREIEAELRMRGAELIAAHFRRVTSIGDGPGEQSAVTYVIRRRADLVEQEVMLVKGQWLVLHIHEQRLYVADVLDEMQGVVMFRRQAVEERPLIVPITES
jgi:hypothetical protein